MRLNQRDASRRTLTPTRLPGGEGLCISFPSATATMAPFRAEMAGRAG